MARLLIAVLLVAAPVGILFVLVFGGGSVAQCLGGSACGYPPPDTSGAIDEAREVVPLLIGLAAMWFVAAVAGVGDVWRRDRIRIVQGARLSFMLIALTGVVVAIWRFAEGQRLRVVAEDAGLYALVMAGVVLPLALVWAVLTVRAVGAVAPGD